MKKILLFFFIIVSSFELIFAQKVLVCTNLQVIINAEKSVEIPIYKIKGKIENYLLLKDLAKIFSATLTYHNVGKYVSFNCRGEKVYFYFDRNYLIWSNQKIFLNSEVINVNNKTYVPISILNNNVFANIFNAYVEYRKLDDLLILNFNDNIVLSYYITEKFARIELKYPSHIQYEYSLENEYILLTFFGGKIEPKEYKIIDGLVNKIQVLSQNGGCVVKIFLPYKNIQIKKENFVGKIVLNIDKQLVSKPQEFKEKKIGIERTTYSSNFLSLTKKSTKNENTRKKIIVLDPGHGGEDPGAVGKYNNQEKNINLTIAKFLKEKLEEDGNFIVYLTREEDVFIPLVKRTEFANNKNADLFISIHCNASEKSSKADCGFEIYFLSETATDPDAVATEKLENEVIKFEKQTEEINKLQKILWSMIVNEFINESSKLCSLVGQEVIQRTQQNYRGVKQAGFYVLRGTQMPSVLVECGFISDTKEELKLIRPEFQKLIADGIYAGIKRYFENGEK